MELGFEIQILRAYENEVIPKKVPDDIVAIIPLGGSMGANDDHLFSWLTDERELLRDAIAKDVPVFAICLGAQILAVAAGGKVERSKKSEIGIYKIERNSNLDDVFNFMDSAPVAQWHEDIVSKLPDGATLLASSQLCENQIYKLGSNTYATQFHPEIDASIIRLWEADADNAFLESGKSSVESEVAAAENELERVWKPIVQNWGKRIN